MYQLRLAMESGNHSEFVEVCGLVSETTAAKFLTSLFLQETKITSEQFQLLMDKVQLKNNEISILQSKTLTWALKSKSVLLDSLIAHPNFNPLPEISRYASDCPVSFFRTLLSSGKISVDRNTLDCLLTINHPGKLQIYLDSEQLVIPSGDCVASLAAKHQTHHYSMEVLLSHIKIDASKVNKKQLDHWKQSCPDVIKALENKAQTPN